MQPTSWAHFEVLGPIGAGGMGEVYRARDTRLNREVALKVLPEALAQSPERIARFQREAQVLASLNHPHIASIHGIEEAGDRRLLVMELATGEDLTLRIQRGLGLEDALEIAQQIASALEEAHDKGIVHRDLKPANVNVDAENRVKVLDFGLAKAFEEEAGDSSQHLTQSPTISAAMTGANVILGTAAYMSPEQAKGKAADRRADIWAFGVVLFEMLTGEQVFHGETISETLAAVMKDPVPWERLRDDLPPEIHGLLIRCLERDPKRRLQAIGEARILIEAFRSGETIATSGVGLAGPREETAAEAKGGSAGITRWLPWVLVGIVSIAAVVVTGIRGPDSVPGDAPVRKYHFDTRFTESQTRPFQISPDGRSIAYVSGRVLWIRALSDLEPRILVDPGPGSPGDGIFVPFWSPDSRLVGYSTNGKLWKVTADGGNPTAICNLSGACVGGAWLEDDRIVYSLTRGDVFEVSARGGDPRVIIPRGESDIDFHHVSVLPGNAFVYTLHRTEGVDTMEMFDQGQRHVLLRIDAGVLTGSPQVINYPAYSPTGHILYRRDQGNLGIWALPFNADTREVTGDPFLVAPDGSQPTVSRDGTLVYTPNPGGSRNELVWVDRGGKVLDVLGEPARGLASPSLSPDGTRVVYVAEEGDANDVWVYDIVRKSRTRLTFTPGDENQPTWIPGRDMVAFNAVSDEGRAICARAADGSGETEVLAVGAAGPAFSPDGRFMACQQVEGVVGDILVIDLTGETEPRTLVSGGTGFYRPQFSPDGRYIAYLSWESGTPLHYIRPVSGGSGMWEIPRSWESALIWRDDEIVYMGNGDVHELLSIPVSTEPTLTLGTPQTLFLLEPLDIARYGSFAMTADHGRFLMTRTLESEQIRGGMVVVENWAREFEDAAR